MSDEQMAETPMEWEGAEERFVEGYSGFNTSVIYVFAFVIALMLWMFLAIVVGGGFFVGLFWMIVCTILGTIGAVMVKKMLVG